MDAPKIMWHFCHIFDALAIQLPSSSRILPQAIVADIAESDAITTHENREGMFYAARTFAFKLGQSVAMLTFTSVAKIGTGGAGYRLSAIIAAVLCFIGGLIFLKYHENKIFDVINKDK